jgi:hypothetical protein
VCFTFFVCDDVDGSNFSVSTAAAVVAAFLSLVAAAAVVAAFLSLVVVSGILPRFFCFRFCYPHNFTSH